MAADSDFTGGSATDDGFPPGSDDEGLGDVLVQLSFAVQLILGRAATAHGLSVIQVRLLGILRDREPTMASLARFLVLDKSSITGLVDRAERRGLVRRSAAPQDGRSVQVAITPHGREVFSVFAQDAGREIDALTDGFTGAEGDRLAELAGRIVRKDAAARGVSSVAR
jgi:MarR family transcriptional regulator, lower aerobic nicotinate degradation pathway regulator